MVVNGRVTGGVGWVEVCLPQLAWRECGVGRGLRLEIKSLCEVRRGVLTVAWDRGVWPGWGINLGG